MLAEWERQREEERKRRELEEAKQQKRENTEKRRGQKVQEDAIRERWAEDAEAEAKTNVNSRVQVVKPTPMPGGLSPEAQAAFMHGGTSATSWIGSNTSNLQAQYAADLTRQKEREREKAAYDQRMGEHTADQDVDKSKAKQIPVDVNEDTNWMSNLWNSSTSALGSLFSPTDGSPIIIIVVVVVALVALGGMAWEAERRHRSSGVCLPGSAVAACFDDRGIIDFEPNQLIPKTEFDEFEISLYQDIDSYERNPGDWGRSEYDTPFYDGNGRFKFPGVEDRPDNVVCIEGIVCNQQSAVNYIGQGAYSAGSGESLEDALKRADQWNSTLYGHPASPEELYWVTYGYNDYAAYKQCEALVNQGAVGSLSECR